jgi:hypothetical protein
MQVLGTVIHLIVTGVVVTATELTISWNKIQSVDSVETAGQIIPLVIGIVTLVRLIYLRLGAQMKGKLAPDVEADVAVNKRTARPHQFFRSSLHLHRRHSIAK